MHGLRPRNPAQYNFQCADTVADIYIRFSAIEALPTLYNHNICCVGTILAYAAKRTIATTKPMIALDRSAIEASTSIAYLTRRVLNACKDNLVWERTASSTLSYFEPLHLLCLSEAGKCSG